MKYSKDKRVTLRLSNDLYLVLKKKAAEKEIKPSAAIRPLIVMGLDENKLYLDVDPIIWELHEFSGVMARIGGNLNQIAHYFNMSDTVNEGELEIVHKALQIKFGEIAIYLKTLKHKLIDERDIAS